MSAYKKGNVFYEAYVEQGKISIHLYVLRTIRGGVAYLVEKNECTWGKRSKKRLIRLKRTLPHEWREF